MGANLKSVSIVKRSKTWQAMGFLYRMMRPVIDPVQTAHIIPKYFSFFMSYRKFRRLGPTADLPDCIDLQPQLGEANSYHQFDHYFYQDIWAARKIFNSKVFRHVDIGSKLGFVGFLSAFTHVTFIDYRPLNIRLANFECLGGDITRLPFADSSVPSLSCLHVAEHIGLGRYGDPLDPEGTYKACRELSRVLSVGGLLYFSVPIGSPRICFNAHRIHAPQQILDYFSDLSLVEFSGIDDGRNFIENTSPEPFGKMRYGCGLFCFRKDI